MRYITPLVLASLFGLPGLSFASRSVTEYWDDAKTKAKSVQVFDDQGRQTGEWIIWYENGQMKSKSSFLHGEQLLFESWFDNGEKEIQEPFAEGMPHGLWIWWGANGKILAKSFFMMGTGTEYYFNSDETIRRKVIWVSGVRVSELLPPFN